MQAPEPPEAEVHATFERVLEQGLRSHQVVEALRRPGGTLDLERLRARALRARDGIAAAAAIEYRQFVKARARLFATADDGAADEGTAPGRPHAAGRPAPVSAVLVTCTAAVAAVTFLITAFLLLALGGRPYISEGLAVAGLIAAVLAAAGAAGDLGHTLVRVLRHRSAGRAEEPDDAAPDPARAREEWELALLERGVLPFLLGRLEEDLNREGRPGRRSGSSGLTQGRHRARASGDR